MSDHFVELWEWMCGNTLVDFWLLLRVVSVRIFLDENVPITVNLSKL